MAKTNINIGLINAVNNNKLHYEVENSVFKTKNYKQQKEEE